MPIQEVHHKWFSPNLSLATEMLTVGESGVPVVLFPTTKGSYMQNRDFGLVGVVAPLIEAGLIQVICVDSVDAHSFYNYDIDPASRIRNHMWFDRMVLEEVVLPAIERSGESRVIVGGCSFGGYHAANFAFRYPHLVSNMISMGGAFDIRQFVFGHYDDNVYFNNPVDFVKGLSDHNIMTHMRRMGIILGTGHDDICRADNYQMSEILNSKGIVHWLDDRPGVGHDWPWWRDMFAHYMGTIFSG